MREILNKFLFISIIILAFKGNLLAQSAKADSLANALVLIRDNKKKAVILLNLSEELNLSNALKALEYAKQAEMLAKKLNWKEGLAASYNRLSLVYSTLGKKTEMFYYSLNFLTLSKELNNKPYLAAANMQMGVVYGDIGNNSKSREYFIEGLKLFTDLHDHDNIASSLMNIGTIYGEEKEYKKALSYFLKAIPIAERSPNKKTYGYCGLNIGEAYTQMRRYADALIYLKKGLSFFEERKDSFFISSYQINLAEAHMGQGNFKKALSLLYQGLETTQRICSKEYECRAFKDLAKIYTDEANFRKALQYTVLYHSRNDSLYSQQAAKRIAELESELKINTLLKSYEIQQLKLSRRSYLIVGLVAIILVIIIVCLLFVRQIRLKNVQKASLLEQKALRAQINPHFFSNALNSIQNLIAKGDQENAHEYIAKFSALMRSVLNNSDKTFVSISEELAAIKLYLEIELLRVKNEFEYEINAEVEELYDIEMPAMLIQPYIENAIWHGLVGKRKNGRVIVSVIKENDFILFVIEDNGVGRGFYETKKTKKDNGKPSGMKLVEDRINSINALGKTKLQVSIVDLKDENNTPIGTRVNITMSLVD